MAKRPTQKTITSGFSSASMLNYNVNEVLTAFDNTLSLDGSAPNAMGADFDMNSNDILNVGDITAVNVTVTGALTGDFDAATILNGTVPPTTEGSDGDFYIDTATSTLYGPKATTWPAGVSLVGSGALAYTKSTFTATGGQTTFNVTYTVGYVDVFFNGAKLGEADYTASNGTTVVLAAGATAGDIVEIIAWAMISPAASHITYNQGGASAVDRTVEGRLQDIVSVKDFGAVGDGVTDDTAAFVAAAAAAGEGGTVVCPSNIYSLTTINCLPVSFIGDGAGSTVFKFDNTSPSDGFVFAAPTQLNVQFGAENATVQTRNGHGASAFNLPKGGSLNDLRPMPTFRNLAFRGEDASGFAQDYSWEWMFNLGDAWGLVIEHIDACGSFRPENNPAGQFVDGFMRTNPSQNILTAWVSNITTHNVARFWEIRQKTYLRLHNIDVARSQKGIYDAPDRVFEANPYAYGESHWTGVVINSSEVGVDLRYRYATNADGLVIQRADDAFDFGGDWIGLRLKQSRACVVNGLSLGAGGTLVNDKIGYILDGCDAVTFNGVNFGTLDFCARVGVSGSAFGATQSHQVANFATFADVGTVLDVQNARSFKAVNFAKSSGFTISTFASYADAVSRAGTFILNAPTDNALEFVDDLFWVDPSAATNEKRWRWNNAGGNLNLATQNDDLSTGQNVILLKRTGSTIDEVEIRAPRITHSTGASWYNGPGTPEGSVTAGVGSFYTRTDGGSGTTFYVKESGTGNTGWVAK